MVKRSRVLEELDREAEIPYEETRLARRATRARPRLAVLLLVGAAGFALEAVLAGALLMGLGGLALALSAWGVWKGRLGAILAAAFAALLAVFVPLGLLALEDRAMGEKLVMLFVVLWGAALLPDVLTLVRDAELQNAYGRWARRAD